MKYKLNLELLKPGDIILVGYNDEKSRMIQERTSSRLSHAMLMWYDSIIHAADLVITENPSRQLFDEDEAVCLLRIKEDYRTESAIDGLIRYARSLVGTLYDTEALKSLENDETPEFNSNRQMCSKFVAQCYAAIGLSLVDDYNICTPQDLYVSPKIVRIEDVLIKAEKWDEDFANSPDVTNYQYRVLFRCICKLHRLFPKSDIMNLNQLESYIEQHPEDSDSLLELLQANNYFDIWKIEEKYCHYLYDKKKFKEYCQNFHLDQSYQAINIKESSERIISDHQERIDYFGRKIKNNGNLNYYDAMIDLSENIIANANKRIEIANKILSDNRVVKITLQY